MNTPVILFDNGETRFSLRVHEPKAAALVITFNTMNSNAVDESGAGEDFLFREGFDVISVKPRSNLWYQDVSSEDIEEMLKPLGYDEVFTYGSSMGGYAAAYFAAAAKARRAILFSPQHSVDPAVCDWDERWRDQWSLPFTHGPIARPASSDTQYVIFYDPWMLDGRHATAISAGVGEEHVRHVRVPLSGHETIAAVQDAGVLAGLLLAYMRDPSAAPAHLGVLCRQRKANWGHAYHLFFRALSQRRKMANLEFAHEVLRRADRLRYRIHSIEPFLMISAWVASAEVMNDLKHIRLGEDVIIDGAVASVDTSLRLIEDARIRAWLLPLWGRVTGREEAFRAEAPFPTPEPIIQFTDSGLLPLVSDKPSGPFAALAERLSHLLQRRSFRASRV